MQQFLPCVFLFLLVASPCQAATLTTSVAECGSKAVIGEIDLSAPKQALPKPAKTPAASANSGQTLAVIPIESLLSGSANAPTAYHGAIAVTAPKAGAADYQGDCSVAARP